MTLTVCLQGKDGIIVASDSRGTFGDPRGVTAQNDTIKKVYMVGNVGVSQAGTQQGNMIINEVAAICTTENINGVTNVMQKVREVGKKRFDEWYKEFPFFPSPNNPSLMRPQLSLSIAGYDYDNEETTTPRMYSMVSNYDFAPNLHDFGFVLAGVAQYALYLLNRLYSSDMTLDDLKHLGAYVITETAKQDGKVGGQVQMGIIRPKESAYMLNNNDIQSIIMANNNTAEKLKNLFRGEPNAKRS